MEEFKALLMKELVKFQPDVEIDDGNGATVKLGLFNGRYVSTFGAENYSRVRDIPLRDDDILLIGYPKTGCHWTWEVLTMIVSGKAVHSNTGKLACFMEMATPEMRNSFQSRRILNTHLWFEYLPKQMKEKKTKVIFTVRNPKDTVVSFYHHHTSLPEVWKYAGQFQNFFPLFMKGQVDNCSFFDFYKEWDEAITNNPDQPILVVSYEDMKEDLPREIRRMSAFIDVSLTDQQVAEIARAAGFKEMKEVYHKSDNYSDVFLRKGQVGDWKNWLTVAQSDVVDAAVEEKLKGTRFATPRYTI